MALVTTKQMLLKAQKQGYAVGHFNTSDIEFTKAIIQAGIKMDSPLIIATSTSAIKYAGLKELSYVIRSMAKKVKIPIALHLDHSPSFDYVKSCINNGYTSVMIDGSSLPFQQNLALTKKCVDFAHKRKIPVEAEIGRLRGKEEWVEAKEHIFTDPVEAKIFAKKTSCDSLAVSIGTSHGAYKFKVKARLDFRRLKEINQNVNIPLVLHGASGVPANLVKMAKKYGSKLGKPEGVPDSQIKKAVKLGICKVNTDTDLRIAFDAGIHEHVKKHPEIFNPREILEHVMELVAKTVEKRIKILGSHGKA